MADAPLIQSIRQSFYYMAYQELETERPIGMSVGYIPITKIWEWANYQRLTESETRALIYVIREIDHWSMAWEANNSKTK
jgi:hypothetical protein